MSGANRAKPSEKVVKFAPTQYEVLETSFINGGLKNPGDLVYLPVGTDAGSNLQATSGPAREKDGVSEAEAFLGRSIPDITADIPALTDDELDAYLHAERGGKARKGVTDALAAEQEARTAK